ncbi:MAG: HAD family hydrolase, partial [Betaproteobacteria bacterium]|nr:HAD family hydrolase [Betaproteobacteria bacterium]
DLALRVPTLEEASYVIGLGLHDALAHVAPGLTQAQVAALTDRYRHHYLSRDQFLRPFDGIRPLLESIQSAGVPMAVATGKSRAGLERAFDATATRHFFADSRCADESVPKPSPDMLLELCEALDQSPDRVLMIGDTTHDIEMAQAAGAHALAVSYGAHDRARLEAARPLGIMDSVPHLSRWVLDHVQS